MHKIECSLIIYRDKVIMRNQQMKMKIRRKKRFRYRNELKAGLVIIALALLVVLGITIYRNRDLPVVTLQVQNAEMREEGELPVFSVKVFCEEEKDIVLDRKSKYKLSDFTNDISAGKGYLLSGLGDNLVEGDYKISVKLDEDMSEMFQKKWSKKISLSFESGTLHVRNKLGDWDGESFVLLDGSYASGWYNVGNNTYYFDKNNNRVTGKNKINGKTYYFGEDGVFDEKKNEINPNKPIVALTFDDGPGAYTMKLLEALDKRGARATFFMLGPRVSKYPEALKKMIETGCQLGNHTTNHLELTKLSMAEVWNEHHFTNVEIEKVVGKGASCMRPPYGAQNEKIREVLNTPVVLWSLDTLDWELKNVKKIKKVVHSNIKDGDIILMHDIYETSVDAAIQLVDELSEKGYQFVTVAELAEYRGNPLKAGEKYINFYK